MTKFLTLKINLFLWFITNISTFNDMKELKCGLVGCGRIGCGYDEKPDEFLIRTHAMSYIKNNHTKLVSLCDVDKNKLKKYGKIYSVRNHYTDFKEMLKEESLDCLSICTHGDTHLKIVAEAVKNNIKGLMIEKPISDSLHNAEKIIKLCKQKKVILAVNHQRRFNPFYQKISHLLKEGKLGKIQRVNLMYGGGIDELISLYENNPELDFLSNNKVHTFPIGLDIEVIPKKTLDKFIPISEDPYFYESFIGKYIYDHPNDFKSKALRLQKPNLLRWTLDYPEDYEFIKEVYSNLYNEKKIFYMRDILKLLDIKPEIKKINTMHYS